MLKSESFEVTLADKQSVILPEDSVKAFIEVGHKRIKVLASFEEKVIEFYAALKKEKSGLYRIYFSKAKQKVLGVFMNDYFKLQVYLNTLLNNGVNIS